MSNATEDNTLMGLSFDPSSPWTVLEYSILNTIVTSIVPVPLAGPLMALGAAMYGIVGGLALNTVSTMLGAYLGLLAVRSGCRERFVRCLGRHSKTFKAIDAAITEQGWQIPLLIRVSPASPMVLSNILLSLTSVSVFDYLWTTCVGIVPSNLPYAFAGELGASVAQDFPPKDAVGWVMLSITAVGFVASIIIAVKLGRIARKVLRQHGVEPAAQPADPMPPAVATGSESASEGGGVEVAAAPQKGSPVKGSLRTALAFRSLDEEEARTSLRASDSQAEGQDPSRRHVEL